MAARQGLFGLLAGAALLAALSVPAAAQKAADTLRFAFQDPISTVDIFFDPKPETEFAEDAIFDNLIVYDAKTRTYKPGLAASWKHVDAKTLELKLRPGITFHDGSPLTADDVVYTLNYLSDPKSKLRYAANWNFIDHAERVSSDTVRIVMKRPTAYDLARLATNTPIYPKAIHGKLAEKVDFGRTHPVGTGPYMVKSIDSTHGIVLVKNPHYKSPGPWRPAPSIGTIKLIPMPDLQTEIATMMTGGLDLIHDVPKDQAQNLAQTPGFAMTASQGLTFYFMAMASEDKSGNAPELTKPEVRKALSMAIERESLAKNLVPGGDAVQVVDAFCIDTQVGCVHSAKPPAFDPEGAKKLLAEAGYPNGFDVDITAYPGAWPEAEAVGGMLRKIGVRASVNTLTFVAYRKKQAAGKIQILVGHWASGGMPDAAAAADFLFAGGPRDYWNDKQLIDWQKEAGGEMDSAKRDALYKKIFNRINEKHYALTLTTFPTIFVHSADLVVPKGSLTTAGAQLDEMHWK
jgi:peptide/nickel transport system substrate-binding protein